MAAAAVGNDEYIEEAVCNVTDIEDNQMKEFRINKDYNILLYNQNGTITATSTKCSHYGALLVKGLLGDKRVVCPWHGACFSTITGDIEDFPGLDSIPSYKVKVKKDKIFVRAKLSDLRNEIRIKPMVKAQPSNMKLYVIIGGGVAGGTCAEMLRQEGYTGRIIVMCREYALPYDRVAVSKAMNMTLDEIEYRSPAFYDEYSIELMLGVSATRLNTDLKSISCSNGEHICYDKLFIATGSNARKIKLPNSENVDNIFTIRDHKDAKTVFRLLNDQVNMVLLGGGFISLEVATFCYTRTKSVSILFNEETPLQTAFGKIIGGEVMKLFEKNGVKMIPRSSIKNCIGSNGKLTAVLLNSDTILPCDILIIAIGASPCTEFLSNSGINVNLRGSVDTDIYLRAKGVDDVYIGGDIANAPIYSSKNQLASIGHIKIAQYHAKIAAANMAGKRQPTQLRVVPYFWTEIMGKYLRYVGHGKATEIAVKGKCEDFKYVVYYLNESHNVVGISTCNRDPIASQYFEYLKQGRILNKDDLEKSTFGWINNLNQGKFETDFNKINLK